MKAPKCAICGSEHWSRQPCAGGKPVLLIGGISYANLDEGKIAAAAKLAARDGVAALMGGKVISAAEMQIQDPRAEKPRVPGPPKEKTKPARGAARKAAAKRKKKASA